MRGGGWRSPIGRQSGGGAERTNGEERRLRVDAALELAVEHERTLRMEEEMLAKQAALEAEEGWRRAEEEQGRLCRPEWRAWKGRSDACRIKWLERGKG